MNNVYENHERKFEIICWLSRFIIFIYLLFLNFRKFYHKVMEKKGKTHNVGE